MSKFIFLAAYVLFILVIGIKSKRESSAGGEDYLLGGRTLGPVITSFSFAATYISGVCIVNAGMIGWKWGIGAIYNALGNVLLSIMFMWLILGRRSRTMSEKLGVQTLPDFLRVRYNSDFFKVAGSIIIFIFMVPYTATVFSSLSYLFESVFGLPYTLSLLAMAALGAFYLAIGGYKAAAKIDVAQGAIMLIGGLVIVYFTLKSDVVGGLSEGIARLSRIVTPEEGAIGQNLVSLNLGGSWTLLAGLIPFVLMTSFAPNGLPQLVSKFFAIKDAKQVKIGGIVCSVLGLLIITSVHVPGFFVRLFYPDQAAVDAAGGFNVLVPQILVNIMPDFFLSIILLLVLSASMSTLAGLVLTSSAALGMDFIKG
ncbi:MAG: sodium:solute symporter, partial [Clostridiales bacterium]|nr:sodium:solute symporter [Clostridiales bacterium]